MSRNNLILVACDKRHKQEWFYVISNVCADVNYYRFAKKYIDKENRKRTQQRSSALVIAHNLQLKLDTEYGVREVFIKY